MYSIKEKNKHLRDLNAVQHAEKDLELLRKLDPRNDQLPSLSLSPRRNAERILYILLDVATAEEIRLNRRSQEDIELEEAARKTAEEEAAKKAAEVEAEKKAAEVKVAKEISNPVADQLPLSEGSDGKELEKKSNSNEKSSKKKTSTPKSAGKTSTTKTSK